MMTTASNIKFSRHDVMLPLPETQRRLTDSLSSLHALEHFGLGRYGDQLDPAGHEKGLDNMIELIELGGRFYLGVPISPQRIEFDGQRVFSVKYLIDLLAPRMRLDYFSYVDDKGHLHANVAVTDELVRTNFGCGYGCGLFEFIKL